MSRERKTQWNIALFVFGTACVFFTTAVVVIRHHKTKELESLYLQENFDALEEYGKNMPLYKSSDYNYYTRSVNYKNVLEYGERAIPHLLRRLPSESELDAMSIEEQNAKIGWILYLFYDIHRPNLEKIFENMRPGETFLSFWRRWLESERKKSFFFGM